MRVLRNIDDIEEFKKLIKSRGTTEDMGVVKQVVDILADVQERGDIAVKEYTERFDKVLIEDAKVPLEEIEASIKTVDENFLKAVKKSIENIKYYHRKQIRHSFIDNSREGIIIGQQVLPLERVGVYVPGGTAAYPSSVLMNVIPAQIAGVKDIVMVTPPNKDGSVCSEILATANLLGINNIYKVGGAQAIGALAYGTNSIPSVDKIVGPGNIYVAIAKKSVYGIVDIDMIAGPSEILIVADEKSNPRFVAADLISQAEHDTLASVILITNSETLVKEVVAQLDKQLLDRNRAEIIKESLSSYGGIILIDDIEEGIQISNDIAPEHLEIMLDNPMEWLGKIKNAGSIFLGDYSPEPLGDYMAGPNHVLPTNGTARFFSPLSVDDFIKKSSFLQYSKSALQSIGEDIITFAEYEGLDGHGNSIKVRLEE